MRNQKQYMLEMEKRSDARRLARQQMRDALVNKNAPVVAAPAAPTPPASQSGLFVSKPVVPAVMPAAAATPAPSPMTGAKPIIKPLPAAKPTTGFAGGMKRGGAVKSGSEANGQPSKSKSVKGWGMARGARAAKIV